MKETKSSIGILTFQNANNYGAVFQAFALQETLKKLGADVKVINYDSPGMGLRAVQKPVFYEFINRYLNLTEAVSDAKNIDTGIFDAIITGSDQVWNPDITKMDMTYFLDFAGEDIRKASYAASIGLNADQTEQYRTVFEKYVPEFAAISLREQSHIDFIQKMVPDDKTVAASIDPSLLLNAAEYEEKLKMLENNRGEYIFLFTYTTDPKLTDLANILSLYTGYSIVAVSVYRDYFFVDNAENCQGISPIEWLSYIKNAKLVLTDSFHGLMLSVVFETPFYAYTPNRGNVVRIMDALEKLGLSGRRLTHIRKIDDIAFDLDYSYTRTVLAEERKKSCNYLRKIVEKV